LILMLVLCAALPAAYAFLRSIDTPAGDDADTAAIFVMPKSGPFAPEPASIAQRAATDAWARSGHSDAASLAFSNWNEAGVIPPFCAVCHSGTGFRSLHGFDGSAPGLPEHPVPVGGVVDCATCHSPGLASVTQIAIPSGVMHPVTGTEAACMSCHQGMAAGTTIARAVEDKPVDAPDPALDFINPHYATAAATQLGGDGGMGYHYPGKAYSGRFLHAKPVQTCASCHDPHRLTVDAQTCLRCHATGSAADIRTSRMSYDGSGDTRKGIRQDISANASRLLDMIEDYAARVAGVPLHYDSGRHPYFFADADGDGIADQADGKPVHYSAWTPRLLKATYNWKFVGSDTGIHVHNPRYALELLHDSMEDLSAPLGVDFAALDVKR
ncbi:MAG TPA: hypothetical protein PLF73_10860, partial [Luteimonas sp.]|nr:hypothetical protein [Luteimonas sp.]